MQYLYRVFGYKSASKWIQIGDDKRCDILCWPPNLPPASKDFWKPGQAGVAPEAMVQFMSFPGDEAPRFVRITNRRWLLRARPKNDDWGRWDEPAAVASGLRAGLGAVDAAMRAAARLLGASVQRWHRPLGLDQRARPARRR